MANRRLGRRRKTPPNNSWKWHDTAFSRITGVGLELFYHRQAAQAKADRLVAEERLRLGWSAEDLVRRPKKDPGKLAIAVRLRRETTLRIKDITARVHLGTYNTTNAGLHRATKEGFASCGRAETTMRK